VPTEPVATYRPQLHLGFGFDQAAAPRKPLRPGGGGGEIRLEREGGDFTFRPGDHVLPVAPRSLGGLLGKVAGHCRHDYLAFIGDSLERLPNSPWKGCEARL
jgi:maltooligosyltrehalose synthase